MSSQNVHTLRCGVFYCRQQISGARFILFVLKIRIVPGDQEVYENVRRFAVAAGTVAMVASGGIQAAEQAVGEGRFAPCPSSPNCVSSEALSNTHYIEPFMLAVNDAEGWQAIHQAVTKLPRTRIVTATDNYIHAECRSRLFRFVDDLELRLSDRDGVVAVKSASRIGWGDLGANRKRVERLRQDLSGRGLIE